MDRDERKELLHKFIRQLITAGTPVLNGIEMLGLGIPEEQTIAGALKCFHAAVETSKEIARYLEACSVNSAASS
jgi:hypothetical protein